MFGQHETPWLTFEESVNRYRVIGPFFSERLGLIPGPTDLGASIKATNGRTEVHAGVYNGEGYGKPNWTTTRHRWPRDVSPLRRRQRRRQRHHLGLLPVPAGTRATARATSPS